MVVPGLVLDARTKNSNDEALPAPLWLAWVSKGAFFQMKLHDKLSCFQMLVACLYAQYIIRVLIVDRH